MKITIQIVLENTEQGQERQDPIVEEIFSFGRTEQGDKLAPETLGLTLDEAKSLLGEEKSIFIEGCQAEWEALPPPAPPLTVGVDGGYVSDREGKDRRFGNFEVIVGKSIPAPGQGPNKRFGYVSCYYTKPKRRLFDLLKSQGMQFNQQVTFLSDGGDTVRDLQLYLNPQDEQLLDWFHIVRQEAA